MATATASAQTYTTAYWEESFKTTERWHNWFDAFVSHPADPAIGVSPKDVIWRRGKTQLYHYHPQTEAVAPLPYLIVPWLGISRPTVLDLLPGQSMVEFLVQRGHDVYLLDWGTIAAEDKDLGFEEVVGTILPRAIDRVLEYAGAPALTLNGICLGGVISLAYLSLNPDAPVRNMVSIVTPVDFSEGGLLKTWTGHEAFPRELLTKHYGMVPPSVMGLGFKMLRPTNDLAAFSGLWNNLERQAYITSFKAMHRWANDFVGMPGRFFTQLSSELYRHNKLLSGELRIQGRRVELRHIQQPLLVVAASHDNIVPPRATQALMQAVSSADKEYVEVRGGHISVFSGRQAHAVLWPKLATWVAEHSTTPPAVERRATPEVAPARRAGRSTRTSSRVRASTKEDANATRESHDNVF